jgi:hypothetical protein
MSKTRFTVDYWRNGEIAYPGGVDIPTTEETRSLIESGVAGTITEDDAAVSESDAAKTPDAPAA